MYVPNNATVYLKALEGFVAGITSAANTDTNPADYANAGQMADAYAQQLDTSWGAAAPTAFEQANIGSASSAVWLLRSSITANQLIPASYTQVAEAIIARVRQANAQIVSEGIDPNAGGVGPVGPPGPTGPAGAAITGPTGPTGPSGAGATGSAATFTLGGSAVGFYFNPTTATWLPAGGYNITVANLDAARPGGLGSTAIEPTSGCSILVSNVL
ncbi:MAG: hypothetical protein ACLP1X_15125 [Polyangiaceae bacterium]